MEQTEICFDMELFESSSLGDKVVLEDWDITETARLSVGKGMLMAHGFSWSQDEDMLLADIMDVPLSDEPESMQAIQELETIKNNSSLLIEDGIEPPSPKSFFLSELLLGELITNNLSTSRISASAEGGICFVFSKDPFVLYLEIYNDGEVGYIIEDYRRKRIIENKEITLKEAIEILKDFLEG